MSRVFPSVRMGLKRETGEEALGGEGGEGSKGKVAEEVEEKRQEAEWEVNDKVGKNVRRRLDVGRRDGEREELGEEGG